MIGRIALPALLLSAASAQAEVCGAFYEDADIVGTWEVLSGVGAVSDTARSRNILLPETVQARETAPIAMVDGVLWLQSDFTDLRLGTHEYVIHDAESSDYADLVPPNAEISQDDVSLVAGCDWQDLQAVSGGTWVQMPEGDMALYDVYTVVVAETPDHEPASLYGRIIVLSPTHNVRLERVFVLNRVE